jgi:hypothetical protein
MGKTSRSTQTVSIPPEVLARYNAVNARASAAAATPFQRYGGQFVAPLTDTQRAGMSNINAAANQAQPYYAQAYGTLNQAQAATEPYFGAAGDAYGAGLAQGQSYLGSATDYAQQGGQAVNASDINGEAINKYMSPYLQNVLQGTAGLLNQQNQQAMSGQTGNAIRQGAFGGDRGGIAAANLQQQQRLADSSIFSNLLNQGYNNALNTAVGQQGVNLAAQQANRAATQATADRMAGLGQQGFNQYTTTGQNVAGLGKDIYATGAATSAAQAALGAGAQNAAIQGGQAQMNAGQVEQATKQAENTALLNQFKEEMSYPFQTAKFESDIAQGTGALSGSTTTTAQPGGFFSDARLKENIEKVGKTYDGQHIYRYNYKGDPTTQIGLIAQEVEHHHPDAVGSNHHYRTVDYDKATDKAADRGHFYAGGLASMGGSVNPMQAGQGFADGGLAGVDPAYMAELYKQLFAAGSGQGVTGMQGIPVTPSQIRELITARGLQEKQGSDAADAVNAIESIGQLGNSVGAWEYGEKKAFGGEVEDLEAKKREEEAGLAKAALEANKPEPAPAGLAAPASSPINPITPVKIDAPKDEMKFGEKTTPQKLAVANAPVKPTNSGSETIGDLGKLIQMAGTIAAMNQGGRIHRDMGGSLPYSGGDSIVPESGSQPPRQLMTAQGTGSGGGGGAGKAVGQIAGLAASLIPGGGLVSKGLGLVGKLFSDERMKENIRPIGELFDGQKVHSFNYKGDPRTQIGLIAQEVEHHTPHAVDHDHGMKTVDYHDATQHAAHRGHFAEGGMPEDAVNSILAGLRRRSDPHFNASERNLQQDEELQQSLHPEMPSNERIAGLNPMPPADLPEGPKEPTAPKQASKPAEAGLTAPMDNAPLPTGIAQIARLIHAGEGTGQNPDSSALGPYQFVDKTFVGQFRSRYPDRAKGMSDSQIINLKRSPEGAKISSEMGPRFIADNAKIIQRGGHEPDAGNVYLAHFLGAGTAVNVLNADPSTPISRLVKQDAIDANRILRNGATAGSVINWARGAMAKQARNLSRQARASGGLAGRNGYAEAGVVAPTYSPSQQEQIDFEENKRKEAEKADLQKAMQGIEFKDVIPAPGMGGLKPAAINPVQAGLATQTTATPEQMARIGNSELLAGNNPKLAPTNGAIGRSTQLIAPGLVGKNPELVANKGAFGSASNLAGTTPVAGLASAAAPERANVFKRVLGLDPAKPYDSKTNNNFFQRLGHGETDAVLAALKGLAAMGTAPTRDLGVALATGVGSGAGAFQEQRAFDVKKRETAAVEKEAESGSIKAKADLAIAEQNVKDLPPKIAALRTLAANGGAGAAGYLKSADDLQNILDRSQATLSSAGKTGISAGTPYAAPAVNNAPTPVTGGAEIPAGNTVSQPAPATSGPKTGSAGDILNRQDLYGIAGLNTPGTTNLAELATQGIIVNPDGSFSYDPTLAAAKIGISNPQIEAKLGTENETNFGSEYIQNLITKAPLVNAALVNLNTFDRTLSGMKNRDVWQGPLATTLTPVFTFFNNVSSAFGNGNIFDTSNPAAIEAAVKDQNRLRDDMTKAFNGTAGAQVMENFLGSNPSVLNSPEGTRLMIATVRQANRAAYKQAEFATENRGKIRPYDLPLAFEKKYPPEYWLKRGKLDYQMGKPENKALVDMIRKQPDMNFKMPGRNETARQYYDKNARSIGGSRGILEILNGM